MADLLAMSHAPICILNTKFDLALEEGLLASPDEEYCFQICSQSLTQRFQHFQRALPNRDMITRLFSAEPVTDDYPQFQRACAHPLLKDKMWGEQELKEHLREACVTHCNLDPQLVDEALSKYYFFGTATIPLMDALC
eukprot:m.308596 g.308596  ORF g.308596 m.308596 type:complete len:138 (+) comp15941_c0_seq4:5181-5594(+)